MPDHVSLSCRHDNISTSDVVLEDVLDLEDRFVKSLALASTVLFLASALLDLGFCAVLGSSSGITRGVARPGCHHFGMTPFYDENSLKLLQKTFENVVASVNVSFMRSKAYKSSQPKATFLLCYYRPHSIAIIDRIVC